MNQILPYPGTVTQGFNSRTLRLLILEGSRFSYVPLNPIFSPLGRTCIFLGFMYLLFSNILFSFLISLQTVSFGSHILKQVFYMVLYLILDVVRSMADLMFSLNSGSRSV